MTFGGLRWLTLLPLWGLVSCQTVETPSSTVLKPERRVVTITSSARWPDQQPSLPVMTLRSDMEGLAQHEALDQSLESRLLDHYRNEEGDWEIQKAPQRRVRERVFSLSPEGDESDTRIHLFTTPQ
jgi:hypothetical protein